MLALQCQVAHLEPRSILNTANYYHDLIKFLDYSVHESFWNAPNRNRLIIEENPQKLLNLILEYDAPLLSRWLDLETV